MTISTVAAHEMGAETVEMRFTAELRELCKEYGVYSENISFQEIYRYILLSGLGRDAHLA